MKLSTFLVVLGLLAPAAHADELRSILRLNPRIPMDKLVLTLSDPTSAHYRHSYTSEELHDLVGPTPADHKKITDVLKKYGLRLAGETKDGLFLTIMAEPSVYETVFNVKITTDASGQRHLSGPLAIPQDLGFIARLSGLESTGKRHFRYVLPQGSKPKDVPTGYAPAEIKAYYNIDKIGALGIDGTGQHIAIATYDDVDLYNVSLYYLFNKISPMPQVDKIPVSGSPQPNDGSALETSLDSEFTGMMAPGAQIHVFTSADNSDAGELEMFNAILDDGRASVVNYSWGQCEQNLDVQHFADMEQVFARAVAQGVNIFVASGDSGATDCVDANGNPLTGVDFPSINPNVIAVGGTSLEQYNGVTIEAGWAGSGGGESQYYPSPAYQSLLGGQFANRVSPDVSFNADPDFGQSIYATYYGSQGFFQIGGTSMAAPQWAGLITLVNSGRAKAGKGPIGFLNPILYGLNSASYASELNDVLYGSNVDGQSFGYDCGPGWDAVTGLGSPNGLGLYNALLAQP